MVGQLIMDCQKNLQSTDTSFISLYKLQKSYFYAIEKRGAIQIELGPKKEFVHIQNIEA